MLFSHPDFYSSFAAFLVPRSDPAQGSRSEVVCPLLPSRASPPRLLAYFFRRRSITFFSLPRSEVHAIPSSYLLLCVIQDRLNPFCFL